MKPKWLGKQQDILHPTDLHLYAAFMHPAHSIAPLCFTFNDRQCDKSPFGRERNIYKVDYIQWLSFLIPQDLPNKGSAAVLQVVEQKAQKRQRCSLE